VTSSAAALLTTLPRLTVYALIAGLVVAESVLLIGSFVPTLSLLLCAGALARTGTLRLPVVIGCAAVAVVIGDFQAYRTGRRLGPRLRRSRLGRRVPAAAWDRACSVLQRAGGPALLATRFVPVVRPSPRTSPG
jgi:undecaprenyl-diphosphatase